MPLKIAILEDNLDRQAAMQTWLTDRFYMYEHCFFDEAETMIAWLQEFLPETLFISLDHDLELKPGGERGWYDPGTGRHVADYLAQHDPVCPLLIHSTNATAADGMFELLTERGWSVAMVRPYGDLAWVNEMWWPAVKEQLRNSPTGKLTAAGESAAAG